MSCESFAHGVLTLLIMFGAAQEGYKETLAQAREDSLQEGFGDGFKEGFKQGLRSGKLIGLAT